MNLDREFSWENAQQIVDRLLFRQTGKHLSDVEIIILRGAWDNQTYEEIAEAQNYTSSYLSKDVGNKLWGNISTALQEKVSKKNFKVALQRKWLEQTSSNNLSQSAFVQTRISETPTTSSINQQAFLFPEGSVALDSPFYLERGGVESVCAQTIVQPGSLIRIKAAKWMGKTSLTNRILEWGRSHQQNTVYLDFNSVERSILQDLDKLLRWLCAMVSRQLKLKNQVNDYWDTDILGSNDNCTVYFEEYILEENESIVTIALDNIDRLFTYEETIEDFFGMLRCWHEKGKIESAWAQLRLVLVHSTEVYIPLDINQSPFNAGVPILLEEFTASEVATLADLYQLDWNEAEVTQLMELVGGHPYLIRLAMYQIRTENLTLQQFLQGAITATGIYSNPLRRLLNTLQKSPELSSAFKQVVESSEPVKLNSLQIYQLHSIGLVKHQNNLVSPSCKLYRNYFNRVLSEVDSNQLNKNHETIEINQEQRKQEVLILLESDSFQEILNIDIDRFWNE